LVLAWRWVVEKDTIVSLHYYLVLQMYCSVHLWYFGLFPLAGCLEVCALALEAYFSDSCIGQGFFRFKRRKEEWHAQYDSFMFESK
jgi:hypothetical protein